MKPRIKLLLISPKSIFFKKYNPKWDWESIDGVHRTNKMAFVSGHRHRICGDKFGSYVHVKGVKKYIQVTE